MHQSIDALTSGVWITPVAKLTTVSPQPAAEIPLFGTHMLEGFSVGHSERLQRRARASLRNLPSVCDHPLELPPQLW